MGFHFFPFETCSLILIHSLFFGVSFFPRQKLIHCLANCGMAINGNYERKVFDVENQENVTENRNVRLAQSRFLHFDEVFVHYAKIPPFIEQFKLILQSIWRFLRNCT